MTCDFDTSGLVDANDLIEFCEEWLYTNPASIANLYDDDIVNMLDFSKFAEQWQDCPQ